MAIVESKLIHYPASPSLKDIQTIKDYSDCYAVRYKEECDSDKGWKRTELVFATYGEAYAKYKKLVDSQPESIEEQDKWDIELYGCLVN